MHISIHLKAELEESERSALGRLNAAVYSPEDVANWPGRALEWSPPRWNTIVWNDERTEALAHAGMVIRQARFNERNVLIGGIGGVMTHPAYRRQGRAAAAIERCLKFFEEQEHVDFGLLVCEPTLIPFYEHLGWNPFPGEMYVSQHGTRTRFTFNQPMLKAIQLFGEYTGKIDLQGPPW